jgi:very-short-patch-repair endonuclease
MGYELKTTVRFAERGGIKSCQVAQLMVEGKELASLTYGDAATLWRINMGWRRRQPGTPPGFTLDVERGYWAARQDEEPEDQDPMSPKKVQVIPFVEDRRNCLILRPHKDLGPEVMASLQSALKNAIQAIFELEDSELAAEPLPSRDMRRTILLYEASEGGAGALRRLVDEPGAVKRVAEMALNICHYDRAGHDLRRAPHSREDCEKACYDCLMSYTNQGDHELLDRTIIRGILLKMAGAEAVASPVSMTRAEHLDRLMRLTQSQLERDFLKFLEVRNFRLPTDGQFLIASCRTRPDFAYVAPGSRVAVYVDGPPHDFPERAARDAQCVDALEDQGWTVLRFGHGDDWSRIVGQNPSLFGV